MEFDVRTNRIRPDEELSPAQWLVIAMLFTLAIAVAEVSLHLQELHEMGAAPIS